MREWVWAWAGGGRRVMDLEGAWSGVGSLDDLSLLGRNVRGRCKRDGVCICKSGIGLGQGCLGYKDRSKEKRAAERGIAGWVGTWRSGREER